ncbi:MAG TPA: hypothetical protein VMM58_01595 [Bacteroidota bacterium]|nr:hypothetical protein [Bacteroidota bacterium]
MNDEFETTRKSILDNLRTLIGVAENRGSHSMMKNLGAVYDIIDRLPERAEQSQLPEQAIRIILNDVRLEALILLADIKVDILYAHQEALAPNEKLRAAVRSNIEHAFHAAADEADNSSVLSKDRLDRIERDLQVIHAVERAFHRKVEEP